MFSLTVVISASLIALILGCIIGAALTRTLSPQEQKARDLESKLQNSEKQLTQYQQDVTQHFAQTASLVNSLTQSYKEVHEHLVSDALKLANVDISRQLLNNSEANELDTEPHIDESEFEPPRDWAPKTPGSQGTLSETFGLGENDKPETASPKAS